MSKSSNSFKSFNSFKSSNSSKSSVKICKNISSKNIVPVSNNKYSLGTSYLQWKDVFVGPSSLHVENAIIGATGNNYTTLTTGDTTISLIK